MTDAHEQDETEERRDAEAGDRSPADDDADTSDIEHDLGGGTFAALEESNLEPSEFHSRLGFERLDLVRVTEGPLAFLLTHGLGQENGSTILLVTPDESQADKLASDLKFFTGDQDSAPSVLRFVGFSHSPYLEIAPDRRATMDRLGTLYRLSGDHAPRFVVTSADALLRRLPPKNVLKQRALTVRAEEEIDREYLIERLVEGGYLRVPVAEDAGTFAVRGGLVDIFPPNATYPVRIELDDWLVMSIKQFDADDQRTVGQVDEVFIHPARDVLLGEAERTRARLRISQLCDDVNMPTTQRRKLLDDLDSGRTFYGLDGFLPAFYEHLDTLFDYLPDDHRTVVFDPTGCHLAVQNALVQADADLAARQAEGAPCFPREALYIDDASLSSTLSRRPPAVVHRLAVAGEAVNEGPLASLETVTPDHTKTLGARDQRDLVLKLKQRRAQRDGSDTLEPLIEQTQRMRDFGMRVLFTARTHAQAERLCGLLKRDGIPVHAPPGPYEETGLMSAPAASVHVAVGALTHGFTLAQQALSVITEEEIFGERAHRAAQTKKRKRDRARAFVEDLRELKVGDYIVHVDHGIGRYLGLERKQLGQSQYEKLQGKNAAFVEVLVVEYATGDRLFLPVTRLNQIEKYAGKEGHAPKLDRLGGQSFSKTKAKVKKQVRQMADELLRLYAEREARERPPLQAMGREYAEFEATFPFEETPDQAQAIEEVMDDLVQVRPMDRVVCGDVGFGKTEVALRAAFRTAMAGRQVALLCPTTVLAQQHYLTFVTRLQHYPLRVAVMSRFTTRKEQQKTLKELKDGSLDVVVGTHRLLSKDVHFKHLGLLIVDEEQRFGVTHKERIKQLRTEVDVLTLSATPIPRTLQMAIGGLRDLSIIQTPPLDRRAVRTVVSRWDDQVLKDAIGRELVRGGQAFFVFNRIEGLYERAARLQALMPEVRFAVAHGQMKEGQLEQVMTDFVDGRFDVLCATAIIESGLDIPRANTMIIDRADMFGLSQLYQLRGRVGRSKERAYCFLLTPPPSAMTDEARYRIEALERFTELGSGFQIATLDMELRGAGELLGGEQSGQAALVGFDMYTHMLKEAVAQLRGEEVVHEVDTEVHTELDAYLPDDYIDDVGLRLSLYKRLAGASDEEEVRELSAEIEDRFGRPPRPALDLIRVMSLKPALRALRALSCDASPKRVTLHLREDTPLEPQRLMPLITAPKSPYKLTPDMRLTRRFDDAQDGVEQVHTLLGELAALNKP